MITTEALDLALKVRPGLDVHSNPAILERAKSLAESMKLSPEQFADELEAFEVNIGVGAGVGSETVGIKVDLDLLERLKKSIERRQSSSSSMGGGSNSFASPSLRKRPSTPSASPSGGALKVVRVGDAPNSIERTEGGGVQQAASPGGSYATRQSAGKIVIALRSELGHRGLWLPSTGSGGLRCAIGQVEGVGVKERYRFMFTPLVVRSEALERTLQSLKGDMEKRIGGDILGDISSTSIPRQVPITVFGRICCEASDGRINKMSIMLEGSRKDSGWHRVHLDLRDMNPPIFSFFPGQVVACHGVNASGHCMVVNKVYSPLPLPFNTSPAETLLKLQYGDKSCGGRPLSIIVACGPFTTTEDLEYEPLNDLLTIIRESRPDVAILCGPFVDIKHPSVAAGLAGASTEDGQMELLDYESLFKLRISVKLDWLLANDDSLPTQFVLVPSLRDAFHDFVYPQPPLRNRVPDGVPLGVGEFADDKLFTLDLPSPPAVHCVGNPAMVTVNEISIGITSSDILFDMSCEEVSQKSGQRLARLTEHLLQQQSFYPLHPPPANAEAQLDLKHADKWRMPITPDVLLLPSKLAHFAKEVRGCLCVNPGQLSRGSGGGTFAELVVHPLPKAELEKGAQEGTEAVPLRVAERTAVSVVRI